MIANKDLSSLEESLGYRIFPLSSSWDTATSVDSNADLLSNPYPDTPKHSHYFADTPEHKDCVFVITSSASGVARARWLNLNDPYDRALFEGDNDTALAIAENRLKANPEDTDALFDAAYALAELDRHDEAIAFYKQLLETEPNNSYALNNIGCSLSENGYHEQAHDYFLRAVEKDPNSFINNLNLAKSYANLGNMDAYYKQIEKTMSLSSLTLEDKFERHEFSKDTGIYTLQDAQNLRRGTAPLHGEGYGCFLN